MDKATALGAEVNGAHVALEWSTDGFWYPVGVEVQGEYCPGLSRLIEAELGVAVQAQQWRAET